MARRLRKASELAAEAVDPAAVAFRWAASGSRREVQAGFTFLGELAASFLAGFCLAIKLLRSSSRSADIAQAQNLDFEVAPFGLDRQHVADADLA